ncbi:MAG: fimbrillin family protein [Rikenellaceae bacterium]
MNKLPYILAMAVLSVAVSCNDSDDINDQIVVPEQIPVSFSTSITMTKGLVLGSSGDGSLSIESTGFGVYGYYTEQESWSSGGHTPNFMYNQLVEYNNGWSYSPLKYWSNVLYDNYSFFAYAPYSVDGTAVVTPISVNTDLGAPTLYFEINSDASEMVDFVTDYMLDYEYATDNSAVNFDMKHQLSRLSFSAKADMVDKDSYVVIKSMSFLVKYSPGLYTSGVYSFDVTSEYGTWSNLEAATSDYSFDSIMDGGGSGVKVAGELTNLFKDGQYLFLLPPNGVDGVDSSNTCRVEMIMDIYYSDLTVVTNATASFTLVDGALKQGYANNYEITYADTYSVEDEPSVNSVLLTDDVIGNIVVESTESKDYTEPDATESEEAEPEGTDEPEVTEPEPEQSDEVITEGDESI